MGQACVEAVGAAEGLELSGGSDQGDDLVGQLHESKPDVVVEFTTPDAVEGNLRSILEAGCHAVSGTTGLAPDRAQALGELATQAGRGLLVAPNFALGAILMQRFAREAAGYFDDVEIIELHHDQKRDAPSGTALHTARQIAEAAGRELNSQRAPSEELLAGSRGGRERGVPIHSIRLPGLLAHQEVLFGGGGQLLTLRHDATDRRAFMPGVLLGIRRIIDHIGLVDSLEPLLLDR